MRKETWVASPGNATKYWLCCGNLNARHDDYRCIEAKIGHPEHVRFGTADEHIRWCKSLAERNKP